MTIHTANAALVFNCFFNGLSIIQALGRLGVKVYALDSTRAIGTWSRYARFRRCPDPLADETGFINYLLERGPSFTAKPVLFPTNDHWATAISKHKQRLEQYYIPCVADWETVELLVNKDRFYSWGLEKGYPVPRLYDEKEILKTGTLVFPIIAKPKYRRISNLQQDIPDLGDRLDRRRMVILRNVEEYTSYLAANEKILPYIIFQEYVPGMADCMYTVGIYADKNYEVMGVFTGRKVRGFPPDIGDCIVGQAEKMPADVVGLVKRMVKDLRFHGIAEFEFKKHPETGEFKLIEINPRSWSWIGITPECGINLPWMAYADLTGAESVKYTESQADNGEVKYIRLIEDFWNCLYANKKAGFPQYHMSILQWWKSLRARKRVYAGFSWDDPVPGIHQLLRTSKQDVLAWPSNVKNNSPSQTGKPPNLVYRGYRPGDESQIVSLLSPFWANITNSEDWQHEYMGSPDGPSIINVCDVDGRIIAHDALILMQISLGSRKVLGAKSEGTVVSADFRKSSPGFSSLPPEERSIFEHLTRQKWEAAARNGVGLAWGFPNNMSQRGFIRSGWDIWVLHTRTRVRPIKYRETAHFMSITAPGWSRALVAYLGIVPLWLFSRHLRTITIDKDPKINITPVKEFDERVDRFWKRMIQRHPMNSIDRNHQHLNWRFAHEPYLRAILVSKDEVAGYAIGLLETSKGTRMLRIVDMVIDDDHFASMGRLIDCLVKAAPEDFAMIVINNYERGCEYGRRLNKELSKYLIPDPRLHTQKSIIRVNDPKDNNEKIKDPANWFVSDIFRELF